MGINAIKLGLADQLKIISQKLIQLFYDVDSPIFGSIIMTITLIGDSIMLMTKSEENVNIILNSGDIVLLSGEARKCWKHIIKNVTDPRRISVTFRTLAK